MNGEEQPLGSVFGRLLRKSRVAAGLSQEALAKRAGMSANGVSALERGYRRAPQQETLELLARALSLSDDERRAFRQAAADSRPTPRLGRQRAISPRTEVPLSNLPPVLTSFIGRDLDLAHVVRLIGEHRLVTLTGAGGIGKTQTALHAGKVLVETDRCAVCFIAFAAVEGSASLLETIGRTIGVEELSDERLLASLIAYLSEKRSLLIFDNCEHVVAQAAAIAGALLAACPHLRVLATSREPLRIAGEQTYRLPSLGVPAAVTLFADRARAVEHRFELRDDTAPLVAEICRRLDGIPLAIELAAARANVLSVTAIAESMNDRFKILAGGRRTALPRQQTMRAAIDWSYDLLSEEERRLFDRLSVFAGGCPMEMASTVCFDDESAAVSALDLFASLVDKSLVVADRDSTGTRYRFLESFREYAGEKLDARGERGAFARRHALAYLALGEELDRSWGYSSDAQWFARAGRELENWRVALDWAIVARADVLLGIRLVAALRMIWTNFANLEGRRWIYAAKQAIDEETPIDARAGLDYAEACIAQVYGEFSVVLDASRRALAAYEQLGDALGIARAKNMVGRGYAYLGDAGRGQAYLESALSQARALDSGRLVGFILEGLAYVRSIGGNFSGARDDLDEARVIYAALGADGAAVGATLNLASLALAASDSGTALTLAEDALARARALNDLHYVTRALHNACAYAVALDRYSEARRYAREALELSVERQLDVVLYWTLQHLAAIAVLSRPAADGVENRSRSARLLGYVDARLRERALPRERAEQAEYERARAALVRVIGYDEWERSLEIGRVMPKTTALQDALAITNATSLKPR